jgi:hypothetical protein
VPRPSPTERAFTVAVGPGPGGGARGLLALTLERDYGVFHLSGRLAVELPGLGWPTRVVDLEASLPAVFGYRRTGGSLEPGAVLEEVAASTAEAPGRHLAFRQFLVGAAGPTLELAYSVDLDRRYFSLR